MINNLPLPNEYDFYREKIIGLIERILDFKSSNINTNTSELEAQIDILVFKLYNLTYDEVKVIDPEFQLSEAEYDAVK